MRRVLFVLLLGLGLLPSLYAQSQVTVTGNISSATSGTIQFRLTPWSTGIQYYVYGTTTLANQTTTCGIDGTGVVKNILLTGPCLVWGNTAITPPNTTYTVVFLPNGKQTNSVARQLISGNSYNLNAPIFAPSVSIVPQYQTLTSPPIATNLIPSANNVFNLGSAGLQYGAIYADQGYINNLNMPLGSITAGIGNFTTFNIASFNATDLNANNLGITNGGGTANANLEVGGHVALNAGDAVRMYCVKTAAGTTPESNWCLNSLIVIPSGKRTGPAYNIENDINNDDSDVAFTSDPKDQLISYIAVCGGAHKCLMGFATRSTIAADRFLAGFDAENFTLFGFKCGQSAASPAVTGPCFFAQPSSNGGNLLLEFVNALGNADTFRIRQDGTNQISNNIPYQAADTTGTYRNWFLPGADDSNHFYVGHGGNGLLVLQDGTVEGQWNSAGFTSSTAATLDGSTTINGALSNAGTGVKHVRLDAADGNNCTTAATAGASCTATITWAGAGFVSSAYTPICQLIASSNLGVVANVATQGDGVMTVNVVALTNAAVNGTIACAAFHD